MRVCALVSCLNLNHFNSEYLNRIINIYEPNIQFLHQFYSPPGCLFISNTLCHPKHLTYMPVYTLKVAPEVGSLHFLMKYPTHARHIWLLKPVSLTHRKAAHQRQSSQAYSISKLLIFIDSHTRALRRAAR